jgi:hypothetical protein
LALRWRVPSCGEPPCLPGTSPRHRARLPIPKQRNWTCPACRLLVCRRLRWVDGTPAGLPSLGGGPHIGVPFGQANIR